MKVYYYTPEDLGVATFPEGFLRLEGFDQTENPYNADVWALQPIMYHFSAEVLGNLKYLPGREERHIVWDCADDFRTFGIPWIAIRCAAGRPMIEADPTTIPWPWPVEDLGRGRRLEPPEGFTYDVGFQGWLTPLGETGMACDSILATSQLTSRIVRNNFFFGYVTPEDPNYQPMRESFIDTIYKSRLSLVVRSIASGVVRYRAYEAMSMGRPFISIGDNVVFPWQSEIDWACIIPLLDPGITYETVGNYKLFVSLKEADTALVGGLLVEWLRNHDDKDILDIGRYARRMYRKWLHRDKWDSLFAQAVTLRLEGRI